MKKHYYLFLLALATLFLPFSPIQALGYQKLNKGLEYTSFQPKDQTYKLHILRVDLKQVRLRPLIAKELGTQTLSVKSMAKKTQALAVLNANFFDPQNKPLGLVIQDKQIKNKAHSTNWWSYLLIKDHQATILKGLPRCPACFESGIQAGPRLVVNRQVSKLKENLSAKSAVGIDVQDRLVLLVTEGLAEMNGFAKLLATPEKQGGIGLRDALNLDGGASSQFYIKAGNFEKWLPGLVNVPVGLGVFTKP